MGPSEARPALTLDCADEGDAIRALAEELGFRPSVAERFFRRIATAATSWMQFRPFSPTPRIDLDAD